MKYTIGYKVELNFDLPRETGFFLAIETEADSLEEAFKKADEMFATANVPEAKKLSGQKAYANDANGVRIWEA